MCYFIPMPAKSMHYYLYFDIGPGLTLMNAITRYKISKPICFLYNVSINTKEVQNIHLHVNVLVHNL